MKVEDGFKVFMCHGAISEMNEEEEGEKISLERFPKGFHYYAGGHMYKNQHYSQEGYPHVVYPGTPVCGLPPGHGRCRARQDQGGITS